MNAGEPTKYRRLFPLTCVGRRLGLRPTQEMKNGVCSATALNGNPALPFVIPRACDFFGMAIFLGHSPPYPNMNWHPDRSVAKWRDLLFSIQAMNPDGSTTPPFVIPSEAEGSAVLQARPGNVFRGSGLGFEACRSLVS